MEDFESLACHDRVALAAIYADSARELVGGSGLTTQELRHLAMGVAFAKQTSIGRRSVRVSGNRLRINVHTAKELSKSMQTLSERLYHRQLARAAGEDSSLKELSRTARAAYSAMSAVTHAIKTAHGLLGNADSAAVSVSLRHTIDASIESVLASRFGGPDVPESDRDELVSLTSTPIIQAMKASNPTGEERPTSPELLQLRISISGDAALRVIQLVHFSQSTTSKCDPAWKKNAKQKLGQLAKILERLRKINGQLTKADVALWDHPTTDSVFASKWSLRFIDMLYEMGAIVDIGGWAPTSVRTSSTDVKEWREMFSAAVNDVNAATWVVAREEVEKASERVVEATRELTVN